MSTTRSKDRAGLCSFTFANGHRCRSLRSTSHPHLCYYHARKESQARAAEQIGRDSRLPRPDLAPDHPPRPGRIHQRFRHRLLAACRLFLRQRQLQIPHAIRAPALRRWPTTPSVFTACPNSATTSVRPCPATASYPTTQLEQPAPTGVVPPGAAILKFQRIFGNRRISTPAPSYTTRHKSF